MDREAYSPWCYKESDTTEWLSTHTHTHTHTMKYIYVYVCVYIYICVCIYIYIYVCVCVCVCVCLVTQLCLTPYNTMDCRLLCPWESPGKNTRVGCHALLQGILPTQGLNPGVPHCRWYTHTHTHYLLSWPQHAVGTMSYTKKTH